VGTGKCAIEIDRFQTVGPILQGRAVRLRGFPFCDQHRTGTGSGMKLYPALPRTVRPLVPANEGRIRSVGIDDGIGMFADQHRNSRGKRAGLEPALFW
jgi:hypothetical protein